MMILKVITPPIILYLLNRYFYIIGVTNNLFKVDGTNDPNNSEVSYEMGIY